VTGRGLAANIRRHYSAKILYGAVILLFITNAVNIGADLGAMAQAVGLIIPGFNFYAAIIILGVVGLLLEIFLSYKTYSNYLKWITFILFAYVISVFFIKFPIGEVLKGTFIPSFELSKNAILMITAVLGTTISPYLFFWGTSQEVEEEILEGQRTVEERQGTDQKHLKNMKIDVWSGMFFSNFVMFCIILVCGATLYQNGITNIGTAADAAQALRPLAGESAYILFALGIIGTGMLAIPVLAGSTSYALAETFGWKEGLYLKLNQAKSFYGMIIISVLVGIAINFLGIDPIKALIFSAVLNGLIAPFMIYFIIDLSSREKIMGKHKNGKWYKFLGIVIFALMSLAGIATIVSLFI
jgi:Mn2+/Fe2+ NRAMP family transporter